MKDTNIQWHPAFVSAMQLEFKEDREKLLFEREHNLNTKPLQIDLLVIKKEENGTIENEIGKIFRKFNILEYKSPRQTLDVDNFYKSAAYACLYKSYGKTVDERKAEDITVSIIRDGKPEKLFHYFEEHGIRTENPCHGIYYVMDKVLFPTQIIVAKELDGEHHTWLKSLTDHLEEKDMHRLLVDISRLKVKQDKEFANSVLEVCFRANKQIIEKLKGSDTMSEALLEIMEPLIEPIIEEQKRIIEIQLRKEAKTEIAKAKAKAEAEMTKAKAEAEAEMAKAKAEAEMAKAKAEAEMTKTKAEAEMAKEKEKRIKDTIMLLRKLGHNDDIIQTTIIEQHLLSDEEVTKYL